MTAKATDWVENGVPGLPDGFTSLNEWADFSEIGFTVRGEYIGFEEIELSGKPAVQHSILTAEGVVSFNGTVQMARLKTVPIGTTVAVVYMGEGEKSPQGNRIKLYKIGIDSKQFQHLREPTIQAAKQRMLEQANKPKPQGDADPFADDGKYNPTG
jgi:hypothetical protein